MLSKLRFFVLSDFLVPAVSAVLPHPKLKFWSVSRTYSEL